MPHRLPSFLLIAIGLFASLPVWSQDYTSNYQSKRNIIGGGFTMNPILVSLADQQDINGTTDRSELPFGLHLFFERTVPDQIGIKLDGGFMLLPDHTFHVTSQENLEANTLLSTAIDTFNMRSYLLSFNFSYRKYREFSPNGNYWEFGAGLHRLRTEVSQNTLTRVNNVSNGQLVVESIVNHGSESRTNIYPSLFVAYGKQWVIKDIVTFEFGGRLTWVFGGRKYDEDGLFSQNSDGLQSFNKGQLGSIYDFLNARRVQETNLIQLYFNLGLLR